MHRQDRKGWVEGDLTVRWERLKRSLAWQGRSWLRRLGSTQKVPHEFIWHKVEAKPRSTCRVRRRRIDGNWNTGSLEQSRRLETSPGGQPLLDLPSADWLCLPRSSLGRACMSLSSGAPQGADPLAKHFRPLLVPYKMGETPTVVMARFCRDFLTMYTIVS